MPGRLASTLLFAAASCLQSGGAVAQPGGGGASHSPSEQPGRLPPTCGSYDGQAIEDRVITLPDTQREQEVEVGSVMLTTVDATIAEAGLTLDRDASFTGRYFGADFTVTLPAGPVGQRLFPGPGYAMPQASFRYSREHGDRHGLSKPDVAVVASRDGATLTARVNLGFKTSDYVVAGASFTQLRCLRMSPQSLRREILYSGSAKGVLTLSYREFAGDTARPAFTQDATFDLTAGNEIGFKGARIKVLGTSNTGVRYVVTRSFGE